ncbi:molybdopterin-dependent oxidoreductase [Cellulomonas sp. KRMCY2]|uniref:molybdopterin-dependent oxidoreductase n=1 Tax=Cellulomonas sp. KRMCY2 TaxID=1304865 RepID=UPI00045EC389|nr:molybdopterin-dependent oxidoreductase [Cellulomonas sp. KRMCY2]
MATEATTEATTDARSRRRRALARAAASGVLAAGLTLAVAQLAAALIAPSAAPLVAVGDAFVDATPLWLKDLAVATFGVNDKAALFVGMTVVLILLAAASGLLARRSHPAGTGAVLLLGVVGAVAATTRPDAGPLAVVPSITGAVAGAIALRALLVRSERATPSALDPSRTTGPDRRGFLGAASLVAVVAALTAAASTVAGSTGRAAATARDALRLPRPVRAAPPVPTGAQSATPGVVDVVTANTDFYRIDTALTVPRVDPATWRLRVHGLVDHEVTLTWDDLLAADLIETYVTLACVSNPIGGTLVGNARWLGLPIRDLLAQAGPAPDADMVLSTSVDGFTASTPLGVLTDDRDAILAIGMNGEPLPLAHGFPARMVVPGLYGYVSATKWVVDLEVTRFADQVAYWTVRGWSALGPVKTSSRIEVPRPGARLTAGAVAVGGTAWAQHKGVSDVEIQVDDGAWQPATMSDEISIDTWRQWSFTWDATPGEHLLRVRASDPVDGPQTGDVAPVAPDGATGWHEVTVVVDDA